MKCEWKTIAFEELLEEPVRNGLTKPRAIRGKGVKMIAMGEVFSYSRIADIATERVPVTKKELQNCSIKPLDILFARQSLTLEGAGKCSIVIEVSEETIFESHLIRIRVNQRKADPFFLYYYFNSPHGRSNIKSIVEQVSAAGIRGSDLIKLLVPYPPMEIQQKITAILSALDDKIELNNKINANLEQQAQAVFTAWFAEAKPSVSFVSLVRVLGGGTPRTSVAEFWEGEIPFFTPKDVYGVYTLETEKSLTDDGLAHCNSCLFPINTVFVTARGTVGKLTLAGRPMAMNQSCYALLGQEGYGQYFIYHLTQRVITHLKHKANGAVFDAIVTRDFESEFVPDIKPSEAANFELKVKPLYEAILRNYEENCRLSALRDMLLPHLLSGACVMP